MLLVPYLDFILLIFSAPPPFLLTVTPRCTNSSMSSTSSLAIITLSSLYVFILITLHFCAFKFSRTLPVLSTSRFVLFCMCSYFDETRTISTAKSRSSSILVKFHLMPSVFLLFFALSSRHWVSSNVTHPYLTPVVILNHTGLLSLVQCWTFKIVIHDRHHSYQLVRNVIALPDSPQSFAVWSRQVFQSRQSVHIMSPTTYWPVLWCYGGWIFDLLCSCSFEIKLVPVWVYGHLCLILRSLSNDAAAAEDDPW